MEDKQSIVYLIETPECFGTKRFKIGMSGDGCKRIKDGYPKGTRILQITQCENPRKCEEKIKLIFNQKFKLVSGKEMFEGEEEEIVIEFFKIVFNHNYRDKEFNFSYINDSEVEESIKQNFENWKQDESFGGIRRLVKINIKILTKSILVIIQAIENKKLVSFEKILNYQEHYQYIKCLNSNIKNDTIYDFNNIPDFIKYKDNIIISNKKINQVKEYQQDICFFEKILIKIMSNCIVNNIIYCIKNDENNENIITIINNDNINLKIDNIFIGNNKKISYDLDCIYDYMPHIIEINEQDNKYSLINIDMKYINTDVFVNNEYDENIIKRCIFLDKSIIENICLINLDNKNLVNKIMNFIDNYDNLKNTYPMTFELLKKFV